MNSHIEKFIADLQINLDFFENDKDYEIWMDILGFLATAYNYKVMSAEECVKQINFVKLLDKDEKWLYYNNIQVEYGKLIEDEIIFYNVFGDDLIKVLLEGIFNQLPDPKSKIELLYYIETGQNPTDNPVDFDIYVKNFLYAGDPELQAQQRLQQAMSDRNQVHLGTIDDRANRSRAISAEEVQQYLQYSQQQQNQVKQPQQTPQPQLNQRHPQVPPNRVPLQNPNARFRAPVRNANLVQPQNPPNYPPNDPNQPR